MDWLKAVVVITIGGFLAIIAGHAAWWAILSVMVP